MLNYNNRSEMAKKEMTLVYYHVPEDKDDPDCPNVFGVPYNKNQLRLTHIYEAFPLKGTYLFRFKYSSDGQIVWLDLTDIDGKLPTFRDKIYVKATRVSWNDSKLHSHYKEKLANTQIQVGNPPKIDFFQTPSQPLKKEQNNKPQAQKAQSNLLEEVHSPKNNGGFQLLGSSFGASGKKDVNLMHGFQKGGDLI